MSSLIQGEPWQQAKRGCCLATGNINERFPNSIQEKKKSAKKVLWKNFRTWHKRTPKFIYETC